MTAQGTCDHHRRMSNIAEIMRIIQNMIAYGTIAEVNHDRAEIRVNVNGRITKWLPVPGVIGQNFRGSNHLRVGTQVVLAAPGGDPANSVILCILYSNGLPTVSTDGAVDTVQWNDGTFVTYNTGSKRLELHSSGDLVVSADGAIGIQCAGDLWLDAPKIQAFEGGL